MNTGFSVNIFYRFQKESEEKAFKAGNVKRFTLGHSAEKTGKRPKTSSLADYKSSLLFTSS